MVTILKADGFRFIIFINDHEPAHVHVFGDGEAKINLVGTPELVWAMKMSKANIRRALRLTQARQNLFLTRWRDILG